MLCNECCTCVHPKSDYLEWIVTTISPLIYDCKPAEILSLPFYDSNFDLKKKEIIKHFSQCSKLSYRFLQFNNISEKIFFYNTDLLYSYLTIPKHRRFLAGLGYPVKNPEACLEHLLMKIEQGLIPDEIGLFLGYPLKDVLGFMGHPSLTLTKKHIWQVYGDARKSDLLYEQFIASKSKMASRLSTENVQNILAAI